MMWWCIRLSFTWSTRTLMQLNLAAIQNYLLNPVDSRFKDIRLGHCPAGFFSESDKTIPNLDFFATYSAEDFAAYKAGRAWPWKWMTWSLSKNTSSLSGIVPTETELKVLDTYWSDHCRPYDLLKRDWRRLIFQPLNSSLSYCRPLTTNTWRCGRSWAVWQTPDSYGHGDYFLAATGRANGRLDDMEVSDEINACSVEVKLMSMVSRNLGSSCLKNETTITRQKLNPLVGLRPVLAEPFGIPCQGGLMFIRLCAFLVQATSTQPFAATRPGKLPQQVISKTAAHGYSSYGNQIGLATTYVKGILSPGLCSQTDGAGCGCRCSA